MLDTKLAVSIIVKTVKWEWDVIVNHDIEFHDNPTKEKISVFFSSYQQYHYYIVITVIIVRFNA